ncbi:hypothetical protein LXA43DRAFT_998589 [Ganoderma leucocontextum]|nr:hypothetical protein LXA43DRAFT_998589 [Ganoderma leucocontextum]
MQAAENTVHEYKSEEQLDEAKRQYAAARVQKAWRKQTLRKKYLDPEFLWTDLATEARMQVDRDAAEQGRNSTRDRWKRAGFLASRLQDGNKVLPHDQAQDAHIDAARKHLETQHWLELTDGKHRYGSNLTYYHQRWKQEDTTENFFRWLDHGGGKDLSLNQCSREQLERERISYLSPEQRLNYLVTIDDGGRIRWARNGQLVDTTAGRWKDAGHGKGIVPFSYPTADTSIQRHTSSASSPNSSSSSRSGSRSCCSTRLSTDEGNAAMHYMGIRGQSKNPVKRDLLRNFTLRGLLEKLLRKTVRRDTWIYVSDKNFNMFVGIKDSGSFQHSSFLAGGLVTSAGLISVKDGLIHALSPLSGHYRTSIDHFRQFLPVLEERGVDMDKAKISKAEVALWGIERLARIKEKQIKVVAKVKQGTTLATRHVVNAIPRKEMKNDENSLWKMEILEGRKLRRKEGENKPGQNPDVEEKQDEVQLRQPADPGMAIGRG